MLDSFIAAIVVFGALFVICLFGLFASNAASARISGGRLGGGSDDLRAGSGRAATGLR